MVTRRRAILEAGSSGAQNTIPPVATIPRRPLTQKRQLKIKNFIESYVKDPNKLTACGTDAWFDELLAAADEPGVVLLENVRHWVEINSETFFITPEKYHEIFGKAPKPPRKRDAGIRKKRRTVGRPKTQRRTLNGEVYYVQICRRLEAGNSNSKPVETEQSTPPPASPTTSSGISVLSSNPESSSSLAIQPYFGEIDEPDRIVPSPVSSDMLTSSSSISIIGFSSNELGIGNGSGVTDLTLVTHDEALILQDNLEKYNILMIKMEDLAVTFESWRTSLIILHEPCRIEIIHRFNDLRTQFDFMETEHIRNILNSRVPDQDDSGLSSGPNSDELVSNQIEY